MTRKEVKGVCDILHWRHNDHDGVSNPQPHGCLLNRLFGPDHKKTSKLCVTGLCAGKSPGLVNSPHKGPVTRKMFLFDDVIMLQLSTVCTQFSPVDRGHYLLVLWTSVVGMTEDEPSVAGHTTFNQVCKPASVDIVRDILHVTGMTRVINQHTVLDMWWIWLW